MDHEDVVDHRVHFGVPEQDREVVTQDFLKLVGLLVVANWMVIDLIELVLDDYLGQKLDAIAVDLKIVHADDWHDVVDDSAAETDLVDK